MRFRPKFAWVQFATAILWTGMSYLWIRKLHAAPGIDSAYLFSGLLWLFNAAACAANYFFTWWEVGDSGLTERRFWSVRTIPWHEVTRVGPWTPVNKPMPRWLEVDYFRPAPISDRGSLHIAPADRRQLALEIHSHAPQADCEFFLSEL